MKTIIIGAGEVGLNIAHHLVLEDHSVILVDNSLERLQRASENLDIQTIHGTGSHPDVLEKAGAESADMIIAVTRSDEVNMVACQMAYSLFSVPRKIARVRHSSYLKFQTNSHLFTDDNMPVDVIISPEDAVANSIIKTIQISGAVDASEFADGEIVFVSSRVAKGAVLENTRLMDIASKTKVSFVVCALSRKGRLVIPRQTDRLEEGDEIFLLASQENLSDTMALIGYEKQSKARNVFIIGGGQIGYEVAKKLEKTSIITRVLESDFERAEYVAEYLDKAIVINGDAVDRDLYIQENVGDMDVAVVVTDDDATNILASCLARQVGCENIITRINQANFMPLTSDLNLQKVVSPLEVTASKILQHVRQGRIQNLHTIQQGSAQVLEVLITGESQLADQRVRDIDLPNGVVISAVYNNEDGMSMPGATTILREGDRAILFAAVESIPKLDSML